MGLWVRTAVSYVLVTLAAVLLVEAVLIGFYAPRLISDKVNEQGVLTDVQGEIAGLALKLSSQVSARGGAGVGAGVAPFVAAGSPARSRALTWLDSFNASPAMSLCTSVSTPCSL
ncbi:MAG TPA: hypothetical protein VGJ07_08210, partial [Rugosimonospora sp.]